MEDRKNQGGSFTAALVGMVVGAVGAATAIFLSRKENQDKIREKAHDLRIRGQKAGEELRRGVEKAREEAMKGAEELEEEIKKERK